MSDLIGILQVPPFGMEHVAGGAETICLSVVKALAKDYKVIVLYGEPNISRELGITKEIQKNISYINAFYISEEIKENGVLDIDFCDKVKINILPAICLLISFERCIVNALCRQICVLGGISYKHCEDIAKSSIWDFLIVPSLFVQRRCNTINPTKFHNIVMIPNGIDIYRFHSTESHFVSKTALLPFRPDWGKGYYASIDFISAVNKSDKYSDFRIVVTKQNENVFSDDSFYNQLSEYASRMKVDLQYVAWQELYNMNELYNTACMVLALGSLEEGFGLTTIEALLSGVPVVSRKIGATPELIGALQGILYYDDKEMSPEAIMDQVLSITKSSLSITAKYIRKKYNIETMQDTYCDFVRSLLYGQLSK